MKSFGLIALCVLSEVLILCNAQNAPPGAAVCLKTGGAELSSTKFDICNAYEGIVEEFNELIENGFGDRDRLEQSNLFGSSIRSVFHDAGEALVNNPGDFLGPDGCFSTVDDNKGLFEDNSLVVSLMDPIWQKYCDKISRADFFVLFAKLSIEHADSSGTMNLRYQFGRQDTQDCEYQGNRMPNPQLGQDMFQDFFVGQLGLTVEEGVTLLGAHTIGHVHPENSGYGIVGGGNNNALSRNAWSRSPNIFNNDYYINMVNRGWPNREQDNDNPRTKNIWVRNNNDNIMLNVDMSTAFEIDTRNRPAGCISCGSGRQRCGGNNGGGNNNNRGCRNPNSNSNDVPTFDLVQSFIDSNEAFLDAFSAAWLRLTTIGYGVPGSGDGDQAKGKLGVVTTIDFDTCSDVLPPPSMKPTEGGPTVKPTEQGPTGPAQPSLRPTVGPTCEPCRPEIVCSSFIEQFGSNTKFKPGMVVSHNGFVYVNTQKSKGNTPSATSAFWDVLGECA